MYRNEAFALSGDSAKKVKLNGFFRSLTCARAMIRSFLEGLSEERVRAIWGVVKFVITLAVVVFFISVVGSVVSMVREQRASEHPSAKSILVVPLRGVIMDGKRPLRLIRKYASDDSIKGILVHIDSPGGVVGPSQELYQELKRVHEVLKKPVIATGSSVMASGAYYTALGAQKIYADPGTLVGSIGVIMELANLEKLYEWAKIKRYVIKTGAFKDTGAEFRAMRPDEERYLQTTINEVLGQFKGAVMESRKMKKEAVDAIADGRIFNGSRAKELGLIDETGTYSDALRDLGQMTGLGENPEIFDPGRDRSPIMEFLTGGGDDEDQSHSFIGAIAGVLGHNISSREATMLDRMTGADLLGRPLFLAPGFGSTRERE
jgi:protease-4